MRSNEAGWERVMQAEDSDEGVEARSQAEASVPQVNTEVATGRRL
jgi:hypothetical protein